MKIIWIFGRSGAGKTTIGASVKKRLLLLGSTCSVFDGDELRKTINKGLSFSKQDRLIAVERTLEHVSQTNGCDYQVVSMITPFQQSRDLIKKRLESDVILTFLDCSLDICSERDIKGLYRKNPDGLLEFDYPENYDIKIDSGSCPVEICSRTIINTILGLEN